MDVGLYFRVFWRFRLLVAVGLLLALALAFLSYVRVSFDGPLPSVEHRQQEEWESRSTLNVTQRGFPEGRLEIQSDETAPSDPGRLTYLAVFYSQLFNGDAVQRLMRAGQPQRGSVGAFPVTDEVSKDIIPFIQVIGTAPTRQDAIRIAQRGTSVLIRYIGQRQTAAGIAPRNRVVLERVAAAEGAELVKQRTKTLPIFVFLTALIGTIGLVLVLENLRTRPVPLTESLPGTESTVAPLPQARDA